MLLLACSVIEMAGLKVVCHPWLIIGRLAVVSADSLGSSENHISAASGGGKKIHKVDKLQSTEDVCME